MKTLCEKLLFVFWFVSLSDISFSQGSCGSPDGSFYGTTLLSGGPITYATANSNSLCNNNLNPGQTYCWTYLYPSSGSFYLQLTINQSCGNCDGTSYISTTACGGGCASTGVGCSSVQYNASCAVQQSGGIEVGNGCTPVQACSTIFTLCITVPAGCSTMDVCPMVQCAGDPGNCAGIMPVELLSFTGKNECEKNILSWTSASETGNDYYTLEKSSDGETYHAIAVVKGAGNSTSPVNYEIRDEQETNRELSYYRLTQTDFDGKSKTFNSIALKRDCGAINIVHDVINESVLIWTDKGSAASVKIYDVLGRNIFSELLPEDWKEKRIHTNNFPKGLYLADISSGNKTYSRKILIQ